MSDPTQEDWLMHYGPVSCRMDCQARLMEGNAYCLSEAKMCTPWHAVKFSLCRFDEFEPHMTLEREHVTCVECRERLRLVMLWEFAR